MDDKNGARSQTLFIGALGVMALSCILTVPLSIMRNVLLPVSDVGLCITAIFPLTAIVSANVAAFMGIRRPELRTSLGMKIIVGASILMAVFLDLVVVILSIQFIAQGRSLGS